MKTGYQADGQRPRRPDGDYPGTSAWHLEKLSQTLSLSHSCTGVSSTPPVCNNSLALERPGMPSRMLSVQAQFP